MNSNVDDEFDDLFGKLSEIYSKIKDSLVPALENFNHEWKVNVTKTEEFEMIFKVVEKEFKLADPNTERKTKICTCFVKRKRRYNYICPLQDRLISVLNECRSVVSEMSSKIVERSEQIKTKFNVIKELEQEIKTSTSSIFSSAFDKFVKEAIEIMKSFNTQGNRSSTKLKETEAVIRLNNKLDCLLDNIMNKSKVDLKEKIKGCIMRTKDGYTSERILIVERIYFPQYLNQISFVCKEEEIEIRSTTGPQIGDIFSVVLAGGLFAAVAIIAAPVVIVGAAAAAAVGCISAAMNMFGRLVETPTTHIITKIKKPYQCIWNQDTKPIREAWKTLEREYDKSYGTFLNKMEDNLKNIISPLHEEIKRIQCDLDNVTNELKQFKNMS